MTTLVVSRPSGSSLWAKAVDELPDEHKHGIDFTNSKKIDILKDLREKAENSRVQFLASRWTYTRKSGETVIMRDLFEKLVRWLDMFKQIGDVAVQYDPMHASLPWAGIRLILQIVVNDTKKLESVMEGLTWISELICRYTIVEALYIHDASAAHKELENAVVKLYANILSHLSYITEYFGQGTAKRLVKSTGTSHTFDSSLEDIRKSEQRVEKWRSLAERHDHIKQNKKLTDLLNAMNQPLRRIDHSLEKIEDNLEKSKRTAILQWLSLEPYRGHHKQVKEGLLKGTGKWLLDDPVFKKWRDDSASSILWLHGIAGSGKSKLISIVIDDAMNSSEAHNSPQPVFFYCSRNPAEPTRSNPRAILASVARQLSATAPGKPLLKPTVEMYEKEEDEGFASGPPEMKEICELIMQLIEVYPQTTIFINAMDECDSQKRGELLDYLEMILQNASSLVKIFVSSRNDQDIVYKLKSYPNLHIDSRANGKDIALFVEHEVERLIQQRKLLRHSQSPDQLKKLIISETVKGAHEMFRWASMQLQHLSLLTLDDDVTNAVGRLPPDLRTLYNELYDMLSATPGELRAMIFKNALHWVLSAQKKLKPEEFLTAITLIPYEDQRVSITQEQILDICNNFIVYDSELHTFRFAHLSVREFLEGRPEFSVPSSNGIIAETCLWTLLYMNPTPATENILRQLDWKIKVELSVILKLKGYADLLWAQHCRLAGDMRKSGSLQSMLNYIFLDEKRNRANSILALWIDRAKTLVSSRPFARRRGRPLPRRRGRTLIHLENPTKTMDVEVLVRHKACMPDKTLPCSIGLLVICAYDLEELGQELLVSEALTKPYLNRRGRNIVEIATENRSYGMLSHLARQREFRISFAKDMLGFSGDIEYCENLAKILTDHWKADTESRKAFLLISIQEYPTRVVEQFLRAWDDVPVTQEMVKMTLYNKLYAVELIKLLLLQRREEFMITDELVWGAINHQSNLQLVEILVSQGAGNVKITQEMVEEGVKYPRRVEWVELLLREGGAEVTITQRMVTAAIEGYCKSIEAVKLLLNPERTDVTVTQQMLDVAVNNRHCDKELVEFLLNHGGANVTVTQQMIETAAGKSYKPVTLVKFLLEGWKGETIFTEKTVKAMRWRNSAVLTDCFLSQRRKDLPIATPVVTAMLKYLDIQILEILLEECGIEAVITMENIHVIVQRGLDEQDVLMELFKKRAEVLDVLLRAAQEIRRASQWAEVNFQIESLGTDRCRIQFLKHRSGWNYLVRSENGWKLEGHE